MGSILEEAVGKPTEKYHSDIATYELEDDTQGGSHSQGHTLRLGEECRAPVECRKAHDVDKEVGQCQSPYQSVTEYLTTDERLVLGLLLLGLYDYLLATHNLRQSHIRR